MGVFLERPLKSTENRQERLREPDVTVSELAAFSYCAKAWHLERVAGVSPNRRAAARRDAGIDEHRKHGTATQVARARHPFAAIVFWLLLVAAAICALIAIVVR